MIFVLPDPRPGEVKRGRIVRAVPWVAEAFAVRAMMVLIPDMSQRIRNEIRHES